MVISIVVSLLSNLLVVTICLNLGGYLSARVAQLLHIRPGNALTNRNSLALNIYIFDSQCNEEQVQVAAGHVSDLVASTRQVLIIETRTLDCNDQLTSDYLELELILNFNHPSADARANILNIKSPKFT